MRNTWNTGGCATLPREPAARLRPCVSRLVLAGESMFASQVADQFQKQGWQVHPVREGESLYRAVRQVKANAVILDADFRGQSGFLACAKLRRLKPRLPIALLGSVRTARAQRFADFVGATALVCEGDSPRDLIYSVGSVLMLAV